MMTSINPDLKVGSVLLLCNLLFNSCFTAQHTAFNGSHDFKNVRSSVELAGDKELDGYLSFSSGSPTAVLHMTEHNKTVEINKNDIIAFKNDLGYFEKKVLKSPYEKEYSTSSPAFVKRLTDNNAYLHVYEHEITKVNPKSALPDKMKRYYISLPETTNNHIYDLECFGKDFNQKMEELFASDQRLVGLIREKDGRYHNKNFSFKANSKVQVVLNLVKDYQPDAGKTPTTE